MSETEWVTGKIGMSIRGVPVEFELTVPATPVKPQRMLPIFQQMANAMVGEGVADVEKSGKQISCKAHCGACCRQAVPISGLEVYQIAELVESMPEPKRTEVRMRFQAAVDHFESIGWFDRFADHRRRAAEMPEADAKAEGIELVMEYFHQGVACPFLEDESCSIHPHRPVVCREYLVTSPAENCAAPGPSNIDPVDLMVKPSKSLRALGRIEGVDDLAYPILTQALAIAERTGEAYAEKAGPEWLSDFFTDLSGHEVAETA